VVKLLSPELLRLQLEGCLAGVQEQYEAAASELLKVAQPEDVQDLGELLEWVQFCPLNRLANLLVEWNPHLDFQQLSKLGKNGSRYFA